MQNRYDQDVELSECVHCGSITLNAQTELCGCGGELYPVRKIVGPGTRILNVSMNEVIRTPGKEDVRVVMSEFAPIPSPGVAYGVPFDKGVATPVEFLLRMKSCGFRKIFVIKALREMITPGPTLAWCKNVVETPGSVIMSNLCRADAEKFQKRLEEEGATIELVPTDWAYYDRKYGCGPGAW